MSLPEEEAGAVFQNLMMHYIKMLMANGFLLNLKMERSKRMKSIESCMTA